MYVNMCIGTGACRGLLPGWGKKLNWARSARIFLPPPPTPEEGTKIQQNTHKSISDKTILRIYLEIGNK